MKPNILIDLYFPAHVAPAAEVAQAAAAQGIDAVVLVADDPEELPDREEVARLNAEGPVQLHLACGIAGLGFRAALLADARLDDVNLDAIEASGDYALIQAALEELDGCAIPICPRQGAEGVVHRRVMPLPPRVPVGVVAMVAGGSILGRDLDIEDAGADGRRVLGATGPFGGLDDLGRFATLLPAPADDLDAIVSCLNRGHGVGVELGPRPERSPAGDGEDDGDKRKGRRRRRPRRRKGGGEQPSAA